MEKEKAEIEDERRVRALSIRTRANLARRWFFGELRYSMIPSLEAKLRQDGSEVRGA
jgi:hypothetical protein